MTSTSTITVQYTDIEAALCLWEWMLERHHKADHTDGPAKAMTSLWHDVGTGQMRDIAWRAAPAIAKLYDELCAEIGGDELRAVYPAYDWDFVPAVAYEMDWAGAMTEACFIQSGMIELPATAKSNILKEVYIDNARNEAGRQWGYPELVKDDPEAVVRAFEAKEDVAEFIKNWGESLDLNEPDPYTQKDLDRRFPKR